MKRANKEELLKIWERVRNDPWTQQELFVKAIIYSLDQAHSTLQRFSEDKYVAYQGFKHTEGNVKEAVESVFLDFENRLIK